VQALVDALGLTAPTTRLGVRQLAIALYANCGGPPENRTGATTVGSTVVMNSCDLRDPSRAELVKQNLIHESVHAFANLVDTVAVSTGAGSKVATCQGNVNRPLTLWPKNITRPASRWA
jgi:hypothetical protein